LSVSLFSYVSALISDGPSLSDPNAASSPMPVDLASDWPVSGGYGPSDDTFFDFGPIAEPASAAEAEPWVDIATLIELRNSTSDGFFDDFILRANQPDALTWDGDYGDYLSPPSISDLGGQDPGSSDTDSIIWNGNYGAYLAPPTQLSPGEGGYVDVNTSYNLLGEGDFIL
jgi:hypothetical protein